MHLERHPSWTNPAASDGRQPSVDSTRPSHSDSRSRTPTVQRRQSISPSTANVHGPRATTSSSRRVRAHRVGRRQAMQRSRFLSALVPRCWSKMASFWRAFAWTEPSEPRSSAPKASTSRTELDPHCRAYPAAPVDDRSRQLLKRNSSSSGRRNRASSERNSVFFDSSGSVSTISWAASRAN